MDAVIFDFDGVVVDTEPIHYACFRDVLAGEGVELARTEYYEKYLGYDDHDCFAAVLATNGETFDEPRIGRLTAAKTLRVRELYRTSVRAMIGATELIRSVDEAGVPVAVCSGALREEIVLAAAAVGVLRHFRVIVAAKDVLRGKPDPAGYLLTLEKLQLSLGKVLSPGRCVVIEDSPAGISAAKSAGMKVLAVCTSYPAEALAQADRIEKNLAGVTRLTLEDMV
jgi:beta-phosphoglucomutase